MYQLQKDSLNNKVVSVLRIEDGASIPMNPDNSDFQQFLKDIKEGAELLDTDGNVVTDFVKELP